MFALNVIKLIHVGSALLSGAGFVVRGFWMILDSPRLGRRWVRIVPHVVDTVLLLSAVALVVRIREYPFGSAWLTAKVVALLLYIGLGMVALRFGGTLAIRTTAWALALVVFAYIVSVAVTRNPLVFI